MENEKNKTPHIVNVEPGTYAWCSCGQSKNLPRCDGSHQGTDKTPIIETFDEAKTVAICACGKTSKQQYCDGSHKND